MHTLIYKIKDTFTKNYTGTGKKVADNTFYQIIGKVISMSITVLAVMIVTRVYGREGYGEFSLMQSWPALFFIVVDFGFNAIATRELSRDWSRAGDYFSSILIFRIFFSLILFLFLYLILRFFPYSDHLLFGVRVSLLLILTQSLYTTGNIFFQVKLRYDYSTISYLIGYVVILILVLIFSFLKVQVMWVSFAYIFGGFITFFTSLLYLKKINIKFKFYYDKKLIKDLLKASLPLGFMFLFSQMSFKEDAVMLSFLKLPKEYGLTNTESVAVYSLPYKIFEVCLVIPTFFMNSAYPILVKKMDEGKDSLKRVFKKTISSLFYLGLIFGILGQLFVPLSIKILGGTEFFQSILVLRILIAGLFFYFLTSPFAWLIVTLGYQKKLPLIYFFSAAFNLTANLIFIPKYSFYAATIITQISEIFVLVLLYFTARKCWNLKYGSN